MYCLKGLARNQPLWRRPADAASAASTRGRRWDQQGEIEFVPPNAGPPPACVLSGRMTHAVSITRDLVRCPSVTPADAERSASSKRLLKAAGFTCTA